MKRILFAVIVILVFPIQALCAGKAITFDCTPAVDEVTGAKIQFTVGGVAQTPVDTPLVSACGSDPLTKVTCTGASKTICHPDTLWPAGYSVVTAMVSNVRDSSGYSLPLNVPGIPSSPGLLRAITQ
jgi:hypothetical protein